MNYTPEIHHRHSIRLKGYDYSRAGAYFVTVCTKDRECMFGEVVGGSMQLNNVGQMLDKWWIELTNKYPLLEIDEYIVMPNHLHGIIAIIDNCRGEVSSPLLKIEQEGWETQPLQKTSVQKGGETPPLQKLTLGQNIAYHKYQTTKQINQSHNTPGFPVWQRDYFEHIIRNEEELNRIREYIINNLLQWQFD